MDNIEYDGKRIKVDDDGFLADLEDWDEKVAQVLAEREGVGQLKDEHMEIVKFMRFYYKKYNAFPILSYVCKNIHQPRNVSVKSSSIRKRRGK